MTLSEDLLWRNLIKDKTFADNSWLDKPQVFYMGIDASADSLTVGNLAFIILGRRLADAGWKPVILMGGGTSLVGDPGGKAEERQLKSREEIQKNIEGIRAQATQLFAGQQYELVDNYDWLAPLKYVDFLREVGKHFSMTELMQRDFVTERMGEGGTGISYAEFSYSLVQGYDFWHLHENHGVVMQIGGSDQWGNMLSGVALIRKRDGKETHALSMPLIINKATGQKFGKSEDGAVWLDPNKTSVYKFYQFWLNVDDESAVDFLKIFTLLDKTSIENTVEEFSEDRAKRKAQKTLAYEVTKLVHGEEAANTQTRIAEALFQTKDFRGFSKNEFKELEPELPFAEVNEGESYAASLVKTGLASSNSEARRLIEQGAVSNNIGLFPITSMEDVIKTADALDGYIVISRGKKHLALIKVV